MSSKENELSKENPFKNVCLVEQERDSFSFGAKTKTLGMN